MVKSSIQTSNRRAVQELVLCSTCLHALSFASGSEADVLPLTNVINGLPKYCTAPVIAASPINALGYFAVRHTLHWSLFSNRGEELGSHVDTRIYLRTEHALTGGSKSIISLLHFSYGLSPLHLCHHTFPVSAHTPHQLAIAVPASVVVSLILVNIKAFLVVETHILDEVVDLSKLGLPLYLYSI